MCKSCGLFLHLLFLNGGGNNALPIDNKKRNSFIMFTTQ